MKLIFCRAKCKCCYYVHVVQTSVDVVHYSFNCAPLSRSTCNSPKLVVLVHQQVIDGLESSMLHNAVFTLDEHPFSCVGNVQNCN